MADGCTAGAHHDEVCIALWLEPTKIFEKIKRRRAPRIVLRHAAECAQTPVHSDSIQKWHSNQNVIAKPATPPMDRHDGEREDNEWHLYLLHTLLKL